MVKEKYATYALVFDNSHENPYLRRTKAGLDTTGTSHFIQTENDYQSLTKKRSNRLSTLKLVSVGYQVVATTV